VPGTIEVSGEIEIVLEAAADLGPNNMARLVFRIYEDAIPPFQIRVRSPSGNLIVERVIRQLPTGEPQSPPPVAFSVQRGVYDIHISELRGKADGHATLTVR
jgi:hypothetical protein